ncbi:MAG TPA: Sec-independent protein translocase protein TatB, partial [Xanthobacteraceae bacterium]
MFDISWTEFLLIGVVALIVIGPKELPAVMRTMGQWARKIRVMAGDFQNQFHEAMREAEMADLKKQVDDIAQDVKNYDPLKSARTEVEAIGKDLNTNLGADPNKDASKDAAGSVESPAAISPVEERPLPQIAAEPEQVATEPEDEADHQAAAGATTEA